jgi:23S rRNA (cytidine1920-2'-O)/16S rRNA (cytidine1409-2'-O)-methyltransferase
MTRRRVDTLLAERGLSGSRSSAAASVRAGRVRLGDGGPLAEKPSQLVPEDAELVVAEGPRYVSRGGFKLENALERLEVEVQGRRCLDVGASTGGFVDCLLQHGAASVVALDVGYGQLDWGLRNDPRVHVMERRNVRELRPEELPYAPELTTIDVSFISLAKVLPPVAACLATGGEVLALVKPQFELGPKRAKGGVVRLAEDRRHALISAAKAARSAGLRLRGFAPSGLPGPKGNRETFMWCALEGAEVDAEDAASEVEP